MTVSPSLIIMSTPVASIVLGGRVTKPSTVRKVEKKKTKARATKSYFVFRLCQCQGPVRIPGLSPDMPVVPHVVQTGTFSADKPAGEVSKADVCRLLGIAEASVSCMFAVEISKAQYDRIGDARLDASKWFLSLH